MNKENNEVDFQALVKLIWNKKFYIISIAFPIILLINLAVYFGVEKEYSAQVLLSERSSNNPLELPSEMGALGALVGFGAESTNEADKSLEIMKTRKFIGQFVNMYGYAPYLLAVKKWDKESNEISFTEAYSATDGWAEGEPNIFQIKKAFLDSVKVAQDNVSNFYSIAITHKSPYVAKEILENLVSDLNELMQQKAILSADSSIEYLERELVNTKNVELRQTLLKLVEAELQKKMMARVHSDYIFTIEDPAVLKLKHIFPNYMLLAILSVFAGLGFGVFIVLLRAKFKGVNQ
ncbi:hypothetical protein N480_07355 [Pseudoalteromonas luteoviolacea S2607]|uniref:hypothetical protein n=1 Tax=Pseudoalteromonas luteoviolacea TaxID=43657 RepID=UPI0007B06B6C|nr:hypothetical protein [Pseudoalteromonas luteoviolacea]KZN29532.1 hypothetical protein N480_07355 [Pseudoalteromonas luteoviolacea S2607]